ncbi:hypothetical protein Tco_0157243 [Tanacetum coccineum]
MANLSEDIQCAGSDTRPHMLDKTDFASWQQRIRLYCRGKEKGVNILKSIDEGPFQMGTFRETLAEGNEDKERYNADIRATNILLQGLPKDIYTLINHYTDAKDIWDNVKMLLEAMKLNRGLRDSNYDQLYAYLKQHEAHDNENKMMLDRFTQHTVDPLSLMSNVSHQQYYSQSSTTPPHFADNTQLNLGISPTNNLIEKVYRIEVRGTMHRVQVLLVMRELKTELGMQIQDKQDRLSVTTATVRIYQKSQENSQKRASTGTRIRREQKEARKIKP